jgi:hypothetical protein
MHLNGILLLAWVISIPVLGLIAFSAWFRRIRNDLPLWRNALGVTSMAAVLANWLLFLWLARIG